MRAVKSRESGGEVAMAGELLAWSKSRENAAVLRVDSRLGAMAGRYLQREPTKSEASEDKNFHRFK